MKLRHLPWLFVVGLAIATGLLYNSNQQQAAELEKLRSASQELEQLRASQADTKQSQAQAASEELTRLREENKDVLRLRNEIRQMRDQNQQLSRQAQTAQAQVQSVQAARFNNGRRKTTSRRDREWVRVIFCVTWGVLCRLVQQAAFTL